MSSDEISPGTEEPPVHQEQQAQDAEAHHEAKAAPPAEKERREEAADPYFDGLLFENDKTGTTKLKSLLRGVKNAINERYSDSDNPDLMPDQLAHFYQDLNGDYNELFLRTPDASIAFIYKSLGCAYSLQPPPHAKSFTEPTKPALKTEGWIMWSTIQLLLGPDEHSAFLMEAVKQWDVKDPDTGKILPKNLPRECFPAEPDKHMVAWYEGVSERLRKEAEDEAAEKERMKKRLSRPDSAPAVQGAEDDDLDSVDSRGPALAYFRNPLYRHVDGRPNISTSSRPLPSPRQTMVERGKGAATTVGNVIRKAASPHLWDGHGDQESRRRDRRRGSVPNARLSTSGDSNLDIPYDDRAHPQQRRIRHRAEADDADDSWESDQARRKNSPRFDAQGRREPSLRHSRSHEPTPSQKEYQDGYFNDEDVPADGQRRHEGHRPPPIGPSFQPSDALPFAAQVARQPKRDTTPRQDQRRDPRDRPHSPYDRGDRNLRDSPRNSREYHESPRRPPQRPRSRARFDERPQYDRRPDDRPPYDRRPHSRPPNDRLRPDPDGRPPNDRRQDHDDRARERPEFDGGRPDFDERPHGRPRSEYEGRRGPDFDDRPRLDDGRHNRRPSFDDRHERRPNFRDRPPYDRSRPDFDETRRGYDSPDRRPPSRGPPRRSQSNRRSGGGSDLEGPYSGPDERAPRQKHTRFADEAPPERPVSRGVDGRRYVDEAPWR